MTASELIKDLGDKKYRPVYYLHGEEAYYIDLVADFIEKNILSEAEKSFNQTVFYGRETDMITILNAAKRFPMMSEYQVILVKEAQNLKPGKSDSELFEAYAENPLRSTILVFCHKYGTLDKRLKLAKSIEKHGVLFESKKLYDNQVPDWINSYLSAKRFSIHAKASQLVAEYLGNDLSKISNELDKLILNLAPGKEIGIKEIEENIGISKEYNVFELHNALGKKDVLKANQIIHYFASDPRSNPLVVVIGTLNTFFSKVFAYHYLKDRSKASVASALKVNPYFTSDYETAARNYNLEKTCGVISLLREYDLRSKGVGSTGNTEEGELMKELVYRILH